MLDVTRRGFCLVQTAYKHWGLGRYIERVLSKPIQPTNFFITQCFAIHLCLMSSLQVFYAARVDSIGRFYPYSMQLSSTQWMASPSHGSPTLFLLSDLQ